MEKWIEDYQELSTKEKEILQRLLNFKRNLPKSDQEILEELIDRGSYVEEILTI
jgi:hypothetical protein